LVDQAQPLQHDTQRTTIARRGVAEHRGDQVAQAFDAFEQPHLLQPRCRVETTCATGLGTMCLDIQRRLQQHLHVLGEALGELFAIGIGQHLEQARDALVPLQLGVERGDQRGHARRDQLDPRSQHRFGRWPVRRLAAAIVLRRQCRFGGHQRSGPPALALTLARLHLVHRLIGAPQQLLAAAPGVVGEQRDAEAGRQLEGHAVDHQRFAQALPHAFQQRFQFAFVVQAFADQHELVATEPGHVILRTQRALQPLRHFHQQTVADGMAVAIVDRLEVVQIQHAGGDQSLAALGAGDGALQMHVQRAAVGQSGERVVQGKIGLALLFFLQQAASLVLAQRQPGGVGQLVQQPA